MKGFVYVACGTLFGFILHQGRVTDYDAIVGMFRLTDLHLMGVMGTAIAVAAAGLALLRRRGRPAVNGEPIESRAKSPVTRGVIAGSLIFGAGWALTGA